MRKLSLGIIFALLISTNLQAEPQNLSGKIRFIGQVIEPSCEIITKPKQASKINFSNCKIENSQDNRAIHKVNITVQQKKTSTAEITQWTVAYK